MWKSRIILIVALVITATSISVFAQGTGTTYTTKTNVPVDSINFPCKKPAGSAIVASNWHKLREGMLWDAVIKVIGCPDRGYSYASDSSSYWWYGKRLLVFEGASLSLFSVPRGSALVTRNWNALRKGMTRFSVVNLLGSPDTIQVDVPNAIGYWWYGKRAVVFNALTQKVSGWDR